MQIFPAPPPPPPPFATPARAADPREADAVCKTSCTDRQSWLMACKKIYVRSAAILRPAHEPAQ